MNAEVQYHRVADTPELILAEARYHDHCFNPHYHLDYHIGLVVDGVQKQSCRGQSELLGPGRVAIMPPGQVHDGASHQARPYRLKTFRISEAMMQREFAEIFQRGGELSFAASVVESPQLSVRLQQLYTMISHQGSLSVLGVEQQWLSILQQLLPQLTPLRAQSLKGQLSEPDWQRVQEYCREHLADKVSLEALAGLCGLSRYQFLRRFEKRVGLTPHAWLTRFRLEQACALLRQPGQMIANVAADVGFYDQSHFNRAFRQAYGVAPSHY
ncbi:AraC family transcriptional regulator [Neptuniibacter halophilus]|uniref:AraC family transcriptional regulator n=1 Tax=Neptuniibacter halophilus TaxID=651666 RepID=UPI002573AAC0|nr:AraC family transcriptional regulator [Neptuniibacter halophilus]